MNRRGSRAVSDKQGRARQPPGPAALPPGNRLALASAMVRTLAEAQTELAAKIRNRQ